MACCWAVCGAFAQQGGIRGNVSDLDFEVPLPGVKVRISETGQEAESSEGGGFYLEGVEPGAYTLLFNKSGYTRLTRPNVVVSPGQLADVEVEMAGEYEEMDELVVRDIQLGGSSEIGLLNLRMESSALMDSVGSDLMSKAGASDAAQALTLVPGTTVQDGKYAVVRGLPDRYVSSQMNGVRLPTADPDKRAVQLDQFPAVMIESVQVSKTFTPDQQGDASGGAVNIVLKGIPDERILEFKAGTKYNTNVGQAGDDFLQDGGVSLSTWGHDADDIKPQDLNTAWSGEVGVSQGGSQAMYDWSITAGDKFQVGEGLRLGFIGSLFYKRDASYTEGTNDKYWLDEDAIAAGYGTGLTPYYSGTAFGEDWSNVDWTQSPPQPDYGPADGNTVGTSLKDAVKSTEELQWGAQTAIGAEIENHALTLMYSYNFSAESTALLEEDTRGKAYFFGADYDPYDSSANGNGSGWYQFAPYTRTESLEYTERVANSLQLQGTHTVAIGEHRLGSLMTFLEPEIDWTAAVSKSTMNTPDRRSLETYWYSTGNGSSDYSFETDDGGLTLLLRKWSEVEETSDQYFYNLKFPFETWNGEEGFLKFGVFNDQVDRSFDEDTYYLDAAEANTIANSDSGWDWDESWSDYISTFDIDMEDYPLDVSYDGRQDISAGYYMADLPLTSFLKLTGGARFETTEISTSMRDVDAKTQLYIPANNYAELDFSGNEYLANADVQQDDVLPSAGFELAPYKNVMVRGSYTETIARMTFKELVPIQQVDSIGDDIFIGNPDLQMSALKNYDLRCDYSPYPGGLVSVSWFHKTIEDLIDYRQVMLGGSTLATTADNYSEGRINGYEVEFRQALDRWWDPLRGLDLGANFTYIESEVDASGTEINNLLNAGLDALVASEYDHSKRDMMGTPEYLYNLNATYSLPKYGTELGLFYTIKGDTLQAAGTQEGGSYIPHVYAKEYATLNFSLSKKLGDRFKLGFKVKNMLNPKIEEVYRLNYTGEEAVKTSYRKGVEYSVSISGSW
jgi:hypothetical protein